MAKVTAVLSNIINFIPLCSEIHKGASKIKNKVVIQKGIHAMLKYEQAENSQKGRNNNSNIVQPE